MSGLFNFNIHKYYLSGTGIKMRPKAYNTRVDAEIAMHKLCNKFGVNVECTECDKHERKYSNHNGVRFYINRV